MEPVTADGTNDPKYQHRSTVQRTSGVPYIARQHETEPSCVKLGQRVDGLQSLEWPTRWSVWFYAGGVSRGSKPVADRTRRVNKQAIRERVWDDLEASGVARFPFPPHGRIPNFDGAATAADRLAGTPVWREASTIKANPDAPQLPVRRRALRDGKRLFVAVPRLRDERPFLELDPEAIDDVDAATTISGISSSGVPRRPEELPAIDLIVTGCVAVSPAGGRIGKGEGYSDLEFALLAECGAVSDATSVVTTVHDRQVIDEIESESHDVAVEYVVSPDEVRQVAVTSQPTGIDPDRLDRAQIESIPVLDRFVE